MIFRRVAQARRLAQASGAALAVAGLLLAATGCAAAGRAGTRASGHPTPLPATSGTAAASAAGSPATSPATSPAAPVPPAPAPGAARWRYVFPVQGRSSYAHTHHDYPASDIIAKCGSAVVAATSGRILEVTRVDLWDRRVDGGATRGGLSVSILGDDGVRYYDSHLSLIDPRIAVGVRVTAGQALGRVGETGDASACHLHFGISPPCRRTGDWWIQRGVVWPWPYLDSWRRRGNRSAVAEVAAWQAVHGCPTKPLTDP